MGKREAPHNIAIHVPSPHFGQISSRIAFLFSDNQPGFMRHLLGDIPHSKKFKEYMFLQNNCISKGSSRI